MKYLITGGCGFLGSNLAGEALSRGEELFVVDNLSRLGSKENLNWLKSRGSFFFQQMDVRDSENLEQLVKKIRPDFIFHLAGQVAMTTSIEDPRADFEINAGGTLNLLEAIRKYSPESALLFSSTNKVYGDLEWAEYREDEFRYTVPEYPEGFDEETRLEFHSPYGCSKGTADQYILDYARMFNLKTVVFRHSSMYGGRQFASFDQGWIGWFCGQALEILENPDREPFTISGNGKQVRDILHAKDMIALYFRAAAAIEQVRGEVFNIGGGITNSFSLLELFGFLEEELGIKMIYRNLPPRESDQRVFVADISKAKKLLNWTPKVSREEGIRLMLEWVKNSR